MQKEHYLIRDRTVIGALLAVSLLSYVISWKVSFLQRYFFPEFHLFFELTSISIFIAIFLNGWRSNASDNNAFSNITGVMLLALSFLCAALFDVVHVISFHSTSVPPQPQSMLQQVPMLFWIAARSATLVGLLLLISNHSSTPSIKKTFVRFVRSPRTILIAALVLVIVISALIGEYTYHLPTNTDNMKQAVTSLIFPITIPSKLLMTGFALTAIYFYKKNSPLFSSAQNKETNLLFFSSLGFALAELCYLNANSNISYLTVLGQLNQLIAIVLIYKYITLKTIQIPQQDAALINHELDNRNHRLAGIINTATDGIITINSEHKIVMTNPAAVTFFGYETGEMEGMDLSHIIPLQHRQNHNAHVSTFGETGVSIRQMGEGKSEFSVSGLKKNGEEFPVEAAISSLAEGNSRFYTVIFRDISERRIARDHMKHYQDELSHLSRSLQSIREEERKHIARELHDDLGQLLAALRMDLIMLKKAQDDRKNTLPFIDSMDQLILTSITTLRRIATNLRPRALDEGGLFFALKSLQKEFREHHGIDCDLHANEHDLVLNDDISTTVYRVIQESLTNVARHAQANRVSIQLEQLENQLHFKIQDNGQGIASYDFLKNQSFGLIGMRERVLALNGQLLITANADNGTCIEVTLPLTM